MTFPWPSVVKCKWVVQQIFGRILGFNQVLQSSVLLRRLLPNWVSAVSVTNFLPVPQEEATLTLKWNLSLPPSFTKRLTSLEEALTPACFSKQEFCIQTAQWREILFNYQGSSIIFWLTTPHLCVTSLEIVFCLGRIILILFSLRYTFQHYHTIEFLQDGITSFFFKN